VKTLMTLFTGIMLIGCAGADHQSTRVALASSAVFHAETKPNPYQRQQGGDRYSLSLFEIARVLMSLDHVACVIVNADRGIIAFEIEPAED